MHTAQIVRAVRQRGYMNPESLIIEQTKDWAILKKGKSLCIRFNDAIGYVNRNNLKNSGLHQETFLF